ncbi:MAG: SLBB domain-containing protein, partial [Acetobacteraceae bacterium]|nr:SLBB domain-containing protein [Acetobacteraceae bacterium]
MPSRIWFLPNWRRVLLFGLPPALAAGVLGALLIFSLPPQAPAAGMPPAPTPPTGTGGAEDGGVAGAIPGSGGLLVSVSGAVAHPGLYRVAKGERAYAAIAAAGGLTSEADPNKLPNLAARLKDGQEVKVPARQAGGRSSGSSSRVSLNSATVDQLTAIPGFTPDL